MGTKHDKMIKIAETYHSK